MTRSPKHRWLASALLGLAAQASAAPPAAQIERYMAEARRADPALGAASPARGEALYRERFAGGKPATPSCTSCHGQDPRTAGRTRAGKPIEPMALSRTPTRYADAAKLEKWFGRNCREVLGRACSAREKADWLAWMMQQ